jgi:uncharacterized delta-60 repeat protein
MELEPVAMANSAPTIFSAADGRIITQLPGGHAYPYCMVVQSDGKFLVAGSFLNDFVIVRYNRDGTLDTSFGTGGSTRFGMTSLGEDRALGLALQKDGKIVVSGFGTGATNLDFAVARLNVDGSLDDTFGGGGKLTTPVGSANDRGTATAIQADGKIVVAGSTFIGPDWDFAVVRYNTDGSLDTTFGGDGKVSTAVWPNETDEAKAVAIQADGKIVVVGHSRVGADNDFAVVRYNTDGTLDTGFGIGGMRTWHSGKSGAQDEATDVVIRPDGKILVSGSSTMNGVQEFFLIRFTSAGLIDITFGTNGQVFTGFGADHHGSQAMVRQPDGKILVAGFSGLNDDADFAIARYNPNGSLDTSFGSGGKVTVGVGPDYDMGFDISLQPDGKILVVGQTSVDAWVTSAVRLNANGSIDTTFGATRFTEGGAAVVIDGGVVIYDYDLEHEGNYGGTTLSLMRAGGPKAEDVFGMAGDLSLIAQGGPLIVNGATIGTVNINSAGKLLITFTNSASPELIQTALRQITYKNTSDAPPASALLSWTFSDGNTGGQGTGGPLSGSTTTRVHITGVNDAAVIGGVKAKSLTETNAVLTTSGTLTVADIDGPDTFQAGTLTGSQGGKLTLAADGNWSYRAASAHNDLAADERKTDSFTVKAADGTAATVAVTIAGTNDAPVITSGKGAAKAAYTLAENNSTVFGIKAVDAEGKALTWSLSGKDAKLFTIAKNGKLAFKSVPDFEAPKDGGRDNRYDLVVKVSDGKLSDSQAITVTVKNVKGVTKTGTAKDNVLTGGREEDVLKGQGGKDTLKGERGNDRLFGGTGADKLHGNDGKDRLEGGTGKDQLTGGTGADLFVFRALSDSTVGSNGRDTIKDFLKKQGDRIDLSAIDARVGTRKNDSFNFIGDDAFSGKKGQLRYEATASKTFVYGDVNGDRKADFAIELTGKIALKEVDFVL